MTTFELLDFTEAKDLVKVGRFSEALPKLYRLAGSYPQDQEIQDLIKLCLNVQSAPQPIYFNQAPPYQPPPQPVYIVNQLPKQDNTYKWLYIFPLIGMACIAGSVYLPWITIRLIIDKITGDIYFNGWGNVGVSPVMKEYMTPTNTTIFENQAKGVINLLPNQNLAIVLGFMLVILVIGPFINNKTIPLLLLLGGLICLVIIGDEYISINYFVSQGNETLKKSFTATESGQFIIGFGVYLAIAGSIICVIGGGVLSWMSDKPSKQP